MGVCPLSRRGRSRCRATAAGRATDCAGPVRTAVGPRSDGGGAQFRTLLLSSTRVKTVSIKKWTLADSTGAARSRDARFYALAVFGARRIATALAIGVMASALSCVVFANLPGPTFENNRLYLDRTCDLGSYEREKTLGRDVILFKGIWRHFTNKIEYDARLPHWARDLSSEDVLDSSGTRAEVVGFPVPFMRSYVVRHGLRRNAPDEVGEQVEWPIPGTRAQLSIPLGVLPARAALSVGAWSGVVLFCRLYVAWIRRLWRRRENRCTRCGYSLEGHAVSAAVRAHVCSECGEPIGR